MAASSVIVLEDSDTEDVQFLVDGANAIFCQICQISLTNLSLEARQAHYEQHFGEEAPVIEGAISNIFIISFINFREGSSSTTQVQSACPSKRNESMNIIRRKIPPREGQILVH